MPQGSQNYELVGTNCQNIQGLTVILDVSEDLVTSQNGGFSLQLNTLPPPGVTSVGLTLNWIQFTLYVGGPYNNEASFQWQAWANEPRRGRQGTSHRPDRRTRTSPSHRSRVRIPNRPRRSRPCRRISSRRARA